eukprot:2936607-Prymnesium_polylepis.1
MESESDLAALAARTLAAPRWAVKRTSMRGLACTHARTLHATSRDRARSIAKVGTTVYNLLKWVLLLLPRTGGTAILHAINGPINRVPYMNEIQNEICEQRAHTPPAPCSEQRATIRPVQLCAFARLLRARRPPRATRRAPRADGAPWLFMIRRALRSHLAPACRDDGLSHRVHLSAAGDVCLRRGRCPDGARALPHARVWQSGRSRRRLPLDGPQPEADAARRDR